MTLPQQGKWKVWELEFGIRKSVCRTIHCISLHLLPAAYETMKWNSISENWWNKNDSEAFWYTWSIGKVDLSSHFCWGRPLNKTITQQIPNFHIWCLHVKGAFKRTLRAFETFIERNQLFVWISGLIEGDHKLTTTMQISSRMNICSRTCIQEIKISKYSLIRVWRKTKSRLDLTWSGADLAEFLFCEAALKLKKYFSSFFRFLGSWKIFWNQLYVPFWECDNPSALC